MAGFLGIAAFCLVFSNAVGIPGAYILDRWGARVDRLRSPYNWIVAAAEITAFTIPATLLGVFLIRLAGMGAPKAFWADVWVAIRLSVLVALAVGLAVFFWESKKGELDAARREIHRRELAEARALKLAAEARLSSLESRLHPHFLFNTLNSIAALIPDDPKHAEEMVQRLSGLLRFSLDANQGSLVPLEQECRIVQDYLEIEKARFGDRLRYAIDIDPAAALSLVPPLAVQTLVENSVKHVAAGRREGADIRVAAHIEDGTLAVYVCDNGPGFSLSDANPGHGLDNLRERLSGLFGDRAGLTVERDGAGQVSVRLSLPNRAGTAVTA